MTGSFSLEGTKFLVTGGTGGIGRAIVLQFARAGAEVVANYAHREDAAQSLACAVAAEALPVRLARADVTTPQGRARLAEELGDGPMSGFVHCAAAGVHRRVEDLTSRQFDFTFAVNVRAFLELVQLLLPRLSSGASIVALSSEGAARAVPFYSLIGASKGALEALCRHLAVDLAARGVRVNALAPGTVPTGIWDAVPEGGRRLEQARASSPRGELVRPEEVACAAHFLCSSASSGVSGHVLVVDGAVGVAGGAR